GTRQPGSSGCTQARGPRRALPIRAEPHVRGRLHRARRRGDLLSITLAHRLGRRRRELVLRRRRPLRGTAPGAPVRRLIRGIPAVGSTVVTPPTAGVIGLLACRSLIRRSGTHSVSLDDALLEAVRRGGVVTRLRRTASKSPAHP